MITYDLQNFQLKLREEFDLIKAIGEGEHYQHQKRTLAQFADFAKELTKTNVEAI